jgi:hypothetical protein
VTAFIDQFSDHGYQMLNACLQDFPAIDGFIKNAELDPVENERRPEYAFAWPERRMFPIDSPDQAALSRLYMAKQASLPDGVVANCDKALSIYGVEFPLQQEKVASVEDDSCYLLPQIKRFSVKTAEDLQLASEALERNQRRLSVEDQATAAMNLVKHAVLHNTRVPSLMLKLAGMTVCETQVLRDWLDARAHVAQDADIGFGFTKLSEVLEQEAPFITDRDELIKISGVIQELDEAAGFPQLYGKKLLNPLESVFNTEKMAAETIELAGRPVPVETLFGTDPQAYADAFGPEILEDIGDGAGGIDPEKVMIVLPTMPRDLLNTFLAQLGV